MLPTDKQKIGSVVASLVIFGGMIIAGYTYGAYTLLSKMGEADAIIVILFGYIIPVFFMAVAINVLIVFYNVLFSISCLVFRSKLKEKFGNDS